MHQHRGVQDPERDPPGDRDEYVPGRGRPTGRALPRGGTPVHRATQPASAGLGVVLQRGARRRLLRGRLAVLRGKGPPTPAGPGVLPPTLEATDVGARWALRLPDAGADRP